MDICMNDSSFFFNLEIKISCFYHSNAEITNFSSLKVEISTFKLEISVYKSKSL